MTGELFSPRAIRGGVVQSIGEGSNVTVDDTDPRNPVVSASGVVESIVPGSNITVDDTDPANPIVSAAPVVLVPLTTSINGVPELVWDADNQLVMTEVPL